MALTPPDSGPSTKYPLLTKANSTLALGPTRGLLVGTAGTANLMEPDGTIQTDVPLQAGYNPLAILQLRTGGTADNIRGLY